MIKVSRGCLDHEELSLVKLAFDYGYFGHAHYVDQFEKDIADYLSTENVIAVNNGTDALHLALHAIGIGPGDEVLVPSLTFVASYQAITMTGATPVSCEVNPETLSIDCNDLITRITPRSKAIMPVHYAGYPCDMDTLLSIAGRYNLRVVEDAAHAFGSTYNGRMIGSFGDITCFSFDSIKTITCGEGGVIICSEADLAEQLRVMRQLGMLKQPHTDNWKDRTWQYQVNGLGFRYHMSNINAAIGVAQLKKVDQFIARRREICDQYSKVISQIPYIELPAIDYSTIAPFIYVIKVKNNLRDRFFTYLKAHDIETGINYVPNHLHSFFNPQGIRLPVTEQVYEEIISLPLHCGLSNQDIETVINTVFSFFQSQET